MNPEEQDAIENDLCFTPGALLGGILTATVVGTFMLVTAPLWLPGYVIFKVKKHFEPKPVYHGTVRPMGGPIQ